MNLYSRSMKTLQQKSNKVLEIKREREEEEKKNYTFKPTFYTKKNSNASLSSKRRSLQSFKERAEKMIQED